MAGDVQVLEVFRQEAEAVGAGVHVGVVDLVGIPREDHLGALPSPGEDGLHLVGREVLGLVHHQVLLGDAATTNVGEGLHAEVARLFQLAGGHGGAAPGFGVGPDDELQVVVDGLHVGPQLLADVAGQVAQVAAHGHHRAAHEDLVVGLVVHHLLQASSNGQEGLARARLAQEGDHLDSGIQQQLQGELLFPVAGLDAPGVCVHALQRAQEPLAHHEPAQGRVAGVGLVHQG